MKAALAAVTLTVALASTAALAIPEPYFMRTAEFSAILNSASLKQLIQRGHGSAQGSGYVDSIRYTGTDEQGYLRYRVETGACSVAVLIKRVVPPGVVGPGSIQLQHSSRLDCPRD